MTGRTHALPGRTRQATRAGPREPGHASRAAPAGPRAPGQAHLAAPAGPSPPGRARRAARAGPRPPLRTARRAASGVEVDIVDDAQLHHRRDRWELIVVDGVVLDHRQAVAKFEVSAAHPREG